MKRPKPPSVTKSTQQPPPVVVAAKIAGLNARQTTITKRLGVLNTEARNLRDEFSGNELRRAELLREFDSVAKQ